MNKVITINLGGRAYQLEDGGYDLLRQYLDTARARLHGNPDRDEIVSDIEQALAEKFAGQLTEHKNVVLETEVRAALEQMGPVEDSGNGAGATLPPEAGDEPPGATSSSRPQPKRLYRVQEGAMLLGVCNGLGVYFGIDPTLIRLAAVLLTFAWGAGILVYFIMAIVVPSADTPEQKAAAAGGPSTAQDFIRRAKQGYYEAMKAFPDRHARRAWKRQFKQEMREWKHSFRREMREARWRHSRAAQFASHPGAGVALPLVSLLHGALVVAWICALVSLLATGAILGVSLPSSIPVWVALLFLLVVYGMVVWPLKAFRRAYYHGGCTGAGGSWIFLIVDGVVWVAVIGFLIWLAAHFFPEAKEALRNLPVVFHEAVNSIRDWWHSKG